jgi:hypothetical protein
VSGAQCLGAEDWSEVAGLPALTTLSLYGQPEAYAHDAMPELPGVRDLQFLANPPAPEALRVLASRLPGVRTVGVATPVDSAESLDPYAELFPAAEVFRI